MSCFIGGLKDDIRMDVKAQKPRTLYDACELAKLYEEKYEARRSSFRNQYQARGGSSSSPIAPRISTSVAPTRVSIPPVATPARVTGIGANSATGNMRLSQADYQDRRARNQCFFCDELYKPGHTCRRSQALLIEACPQHEEVVITEECIPEHGEEAPPSENAEEEPLIKLNVITGDNKSETMQLKGRFNNKQVHVLIDCGATHNFIHPSLLKKGKIPVDYNGALAVKIASGAIMKTKGLVSVILTLQGCEFRTDFYILPVSGCEVVLGTAWLKTLGDITWNFDKMKMRFQLKDQEYCLQGELHPATTVVGCKVMTRLLKK